LTKSTINAAIAFFVISFGLYLAQVYQHKHAGNSSADRLPSLGVPAATAPATPSANVPATPAPAAQQPAAPATPGK